MTKRTLARTQSFSPEFPSIIHKLVYLLPMVGHFCCCCYLSLLHSPSSSASPTLSAMQSFQLYDIQFLLTTIKNHFASQSIQTNYTKYHEIDAFVRDAKFFSPAQMHRHLPEAVQAQATANCIYGIQRCMHLSIGV